MSDPSQCTFTWDVFARALGKPNGLAEIATCAVDPTTNDVVCSTVFVRLKSKSAFQTVTQQLFTLTAR